MATADQPIPPLEDIRRFVDGEMPDAERAAFERQVEGSDELRRRVEFERVLADRVKTVLRSESTAAPADLRERVQASLDEADETPPAETNPAGGDEPLAGSLKWLNGPLRANIFAVAASLLLVTGAVLWGIFGRPIDHMNAVGPDLIAEAAGYVSSEHTRCATNPQVLASKVTVRDPAKVGPYFQQTLGATVPFFDLSELGYDFLGAGDCMVPGDPDSGHMVFRKRSRGMSPMVSIFFVRDTGQFDRAGGAMQPGQPYPQHQPGCQHPNVRLTDGEVVYFLVCCDRGALDDIAGIMRERLGY